MSRSFSLAHLTVLGCTPPEAIAIAARTGYDHVGLRTMPLDLPGERRYVLAEDRTMFRATRDALKATGVTLLDIEVARIATNHQVAAYEAAFDDAAALGGGHVLCNAWSGDRAFVEDQFARLAELAAPRGLRVNLEFVTWTQVSDLARARAIVEAVGARNTGILIDTLHFARSHVAPDEIDALPPDVFPYLQLCDAPPADHPSAEELMRVARSERLYPGEGVAPIRTILDKLPAVPLAVEVIHTARIAAMGYEAFARECLDRTRALLAPSAAAREP